MIDSYTFYCQLHPEEMEREYEDMKKFMEDALMDKKMFKKSPEDLEQYLHFRKRAFKVKPKKGMGAYCRKGKYKSLYED